MSIYILTVVYGNSSSPINVEVEPYAKTSIDQALNNARNMKQVFINERTKFGNYSIENEITDIDCDDSFYYHYVDEDANEVVISLTEENII